MTGPIERFDEHADALLERLRGNPVADAVFPAASELGDFSLVWHIINTARGTASDAQADASLLLAALLGIESLVVNQGLKRLFNRHRDIEVANLWRVTPLARLNGP